MAKKKFKKGEACDFNAELKKLKEKGPGQLYLLYGEEEYLRDFYLDQMKKICLPDGDDGFSYKRIDGPSFTLKNLVQALDMMPFLSEHTFVELKDIDVNRPPDADAMIDALSSIPEYCTVCFVLDVRYELDGRLKFVKFLKEKGTALCFQSQESSLLFNWIRRRFAAQNKRIGTEAMQRLVMISGSLMKLLIPEIEKIAAYAQGEEVLVSDVEAAANHIPEADVFEMTNLLGAKQYDEALHVLAELLKNKDNDPVFILIILSGQLRKIYGVKLLLAQGKRCDEIMSFLNIKYKFIADQLISSSGKFTFQQITDAIEKCADTEYRMKSTNLDDADLLRNLVVSMILEEASQLPTT